MLTLAKINKALAELGIEERLVKGQDYFYFVDGNAHKWWSSSVYVCRVNDLTLEQWVKEYHYLKESAEQRW